MLKENEVGNREKLQSKGSDFLKTISSLIVVRNQIYDKEKENT